jgi:hypothetical protein
MNKGILIFAHNSPFVDYGTLAIISGGLAKKNLGLPVSLVTDKGTLAWLKNNGLEKKLNDIFEKVIEIEYPYTENTRKLYDGFDHQTVPFINSNRCDAFFLTPYDETLLIDSDFLIFTNKLNEYWSIESSVMVGSSMNDILEDRPGYLDKRVSEPSIPLLWATTVMFKKNKESEFFFKLVEFIKLNYVYFADLFRFNSTQFRNDIAFSIAKHILSGYEIENVYNLPPITSVLDKDILLEIDKNGKMIVLMDPMNDGNFKSVKIIDTDLHVMNKQSIIRNKDALMELI